MIKFIELTDFINQERKLLNVDDISSIEEIYNKDGGFEGCKIINKNQRVILIHVKFEKILHQIELLIRKEDFRTK